MRIFINSLFCIPRNIMKRHYASGAEKRAKKRKSQQAAAVSSQKIDKFFHPQSTSDLILCDSEITADTDAEISNNNTATILVNDENIDLSYREKNVSSVLDSSAILKEGVTCERVIDSSKYDAFSINDVDTVRVCAADHSSYVEVDLFDSDRPYPTDRGLFPDTIHSAALKEMIVTHGPCRPINVDKRIQQHYTFWSKGNLKIEREWLCFSPTLEKVYCDVCWLFGNRSNHNFRMEWVMGVSFDENKKTGLLKRIKTHEQSEAHVAATHIYQQWKTEKRMDERLESNIQEETNIWRKVISRVVHIILTMSSMCIALRGHKEKVGGKECEGGNFLALVNMLAQYDPVLQDVLSRKSRTTRYLSPVIQNELIAMMGHTPSLLLEYSQRRSSQS